MRLQFHQELVHHTEDDLCGQRLELDDAIQAVAELGGEDLFQHLHAIGAVVLLREADGALVQHFHASVGGHDHNHVAEIRLATVIVGQRGIVHDLQQDVEYLRVSLFDFVQKQHTVRRLGHGLGEQTALVITHVARGCADQAAHGMTLHVLGHVKAHQFHTQSSGQLPAHLGLAHPGGAGKHETANGLVFALEAGTGQLDGRRDGINGFLLPEHGHLQVPLQITQQFLVGRRHLLGRNARDLGHHVFHVRLVNGVLALVFRAQTLPGTHLVNHINGLVRQVAIIDITGTELRRRLERGIAVGHIVVLLKTALQPFENPHGIFHRGLYHIDFLEPARQGPILLEYTTVFLEGGRAHALQLATGQHRLEKVGGIHDPTRSGTCADDGMDLIDEENRVGVFLQFGQHRFQAFLKIATVLGTGQ